MASVHHLRELVQIGSRFDLRGEDACRGSGARGLHIGQLAILHGLIGEHIDVVAGHPLPLVSGDGVAELDIGVVIEAYLHAPTIVQMGSQLVGALVDLFNGAEGAVANASRRCVLGKNDTVAFVELVSIVRQILLTDLLILLA